MQDGLEGRKHISNRSYEASYCSNLAMKQGRLIGGGARGASKSERLWKEQWQKLSRRRGKSGWRQESLNVQGKNKNEIRNKEIDKTEN